MQIVEVKTMTKCRANSLLIFAQLGINFIASTLIISELLSVEVERVTSTHVRPEEKLYLLVVVRLSNRLSQLSCNQEEFEKAAPDYQETMLKSGFAGELEYVKTNGSAKRSRKRNIVWFNRLYSDHIKTNIGKEFQKLVDIHFPHHHRLHKICNENDIKVSYSCMPNMAAIISKRNKIALQNRANSRRTTPPSNCRNKANCPLEGKCRESSIIYKTALKSNGIARHYYGCSETKFKTLFNNHKQSLLHRHKRNATELSKAVWNAKDAGSNLSIKWSITAKTNSYQPFIARSNSYL